MIALIRNLYNSYIGVKKSSLEINDNTLQSTPEYQLSIPLSTWDKGVTNELHFWERWLKTGGGPWPDDFRFRCDPDAHFQWYIAEAINAPPGASLAVLDVGAGPLTYLGKKWNGRTLQMTAVDPLAEEYDLLLKKYQIVPLVRTQKGYAERLLEIFAPNSFDLVHARNCIDHSYDPCLAIQQMIAVAKPGGLVYMHHIVDEGKSQQYQGFHHWNLYNEDGDLYVSNSKRMINVTQLLAGTALVTNQLFTEGTWMVTKIHKYNHPTPKLRTSLLNKIPGRIFKRFSNSQ